MSRVLGIDMGDVRVGLAISDPSRILASGYGHITSKNHGHLVEQLLAISQQEDISEIVIGLPLNMDGSKGKRAEQAEKLAQLLRSKSGCTVNLVDERLTTVEAARQIHASGKKVRKGRIDEVAATIILQAFLDGRKRL